MNKILNDILKTKKSNIKTNNTQPSESFLEKLYVKPIKDKGLDATKFDYPTPGYFQQADIVYLPNDQGYTYALVVVDQGSRLLDAEPLKAKNSTDVIHAFEAIYKRKILKVPKSLRTDPGSEFDNTDFKTWCKNHGIILSFGQPGRHRQVALAERKNQTIGKLIHQITVHDTVATGHASSAWREILPTIVKSVNKHVKLQNKMFPKKKQVKDDLRPDESVLEIGTKVRVMLDNPEDISGNKLMGKFRASDIRWNPKERTITNIMLKPGQPVLYNIDNQNTGYTRNQLQVISEHEVKPTKAIVAKPDENRYEIQAIIGHKLVNGEYQYLIHWKGYKKNESTYEPEKNILEDAPQLLNRYKRKNNLTK